MDMLALQTDIQSENEAFSAERFVYAVDHAAKPSARAKQAADIMRTGMGACSLVCRSYDCLPRARGLTRMLLEPRWMPRPPIQRITKKH